MLDDFFDVMAAKGRQVQNLNLGNYKNTILVLDNSFYVMAAFEVERRQTQNWNLGYYINQFLE